MVFKRNSNRSSMHVYWTLMALNTNLFEFISPNGGDSNYVTYEYTCMRLWLPCQAFKCTKFNSVFMAETGRPRRGCCCRRPTATWRRRRGNWYFRPSCGLSHPSFPVRAYRYGHTWRMSNPHDVLLFLLFLLVLPQLVPQVFAKVN